MKVLNQTLLIHHPKRLNTYSIPGNDVISWGDKNMILDTQNLPMNLYRLLPAGYLVNNESKKWESFIMAALAMGYLK